MFPCCKLDGQRVFSPGSIHTHIEGSLMCHLYKIYLQKMTLVLQIKQESINVIKIITVVCGQIKRKTLFLIQCFNLCKVVLKLSS